VYKKRKKLGKRLFRKRAILNYFLLLVTVVSCAWFFYLSPKYKADGTPASFFPTAYTFGVTGSVDRLVLAHFPGMKENDNAWVAAERVDKNKYINKYRITRIIDKHTLLIASNRGINYTIEGKEWWLYAEGTYLLEKDGCLPDPASKSVLLPWSEKEGDGWLYYKGCTKKIPGSDGTVPTTSSSTSSSSSSNSTTTTPSSNNSDSGTTTPTDNSSSVGTTTPATLDHDVVSRDSEPTFALGGTASEKVADKIEVGLNPDGTDGGSYSWKEYIIAFYYYAVRLGGLVVVLMLVYGGYTYIISNGDSAKLGNAKERIFGAIIGYLLLLFVGLILSYLGLS